MSDRTLHEVGIGRIIAAGTQIKSVGRTIGRHVKDTPKDLKTALRAHRVLSRKQRATDLVRLAQNFSHANQAASVPKLPIQYKGGATRVASSARRAVQTRAATGARLGTARNQAVGRLAGRAAVAVAGVTAVAGGRWAYNRLKQRMSKKPRFSSVDVHPRHQFAAVRGERYNRPVYYDPDEVGAGPPRVYEGDFEMTREELIEMSTAALAKRTKSYGDRYVAGSVKAGKAIARAPGRAGKAVAKRSISNMRKSFGKYEKGRVARRKGRISDFNAAERAAQRSPKYRKMYNKQLKKSAGADRKADTVIGGVAGGIAGGPVGAAAGATAMNLASRIPAHSKSIQGQVHHIQGVHKVRKAIAKKKKQDVRFGRVSSFRKESSAKYEKGRKKNPVRKAYRKLAAKVATEDRQEIISRVMTVLFEE